MDLDKDIQKKVYDDLFWPTLKEAWKALWNIAWLVTTISLPIMYLNHYANWIFRNNIDKLDRKLKEIPEENIIEVTPDIWVPILEKLTYTQNEKISDMFLELLKKASNKDEISLIHPKYTKIIENLSEDEALILEYLNINNINRILSLNINYEVDWTAWYFKAIEKYTLLENKINFIFSQNIEMYLNNLESLGILTYSWDKYVPDNWENKPYDWLINSEKILWLKINIENIKHIYKEEKWFFELTKLWKDFLKAIYFKK